MATKIKKLRRLGGGTSYSEGYAGAIDYRRPESDSSLAVTCEYRYGRGERICYGHVDSIALKQLDNTTGSLRARGARPSKPFILDR